jgi:hypothetical protein
VSDDQEEKRMKPGLAILAALAATAASVPAAAEEAAAPPAAVVDCGLALAGNVLPEGKLHKLRFPMCLLVAAEDRDFAKAVATRVVDNAEAAGVAVRRGRCAPNTLIAFTDDAVGQLRVMRQYHLQFYGAHYLEQIDHMLATETASFAFHEPMQLWMGPEVFQGQREVIGQPDVFGAAVVIEQAEAEGLDPMQLADFATLRLLAPTIDAGKMPQHAPDDATTILTLFSDRDNAPRTMTAFDRAYLRSLYAMPRGSSAKSVMVRAAEVALAVEAK